MSEPPLTKPLTIPIPATITEAVGVAQSDIIIRTAIVAALADMRANPWLLDFAFASLPRDSLTFRTYGEKEVARAKEWFLQNNIEVVMGVRVSDGAPPPFAVSIHLLSSDEQENTLGDIHAFTAEEMEASWKPLTDKFAPKSYSALTGTFVLPDNIKLSLSTSMAVVDRFGNSHPIIDVVDDTTCHLDIGTVADFSVCFIKPIFNRLIASLESAEFREVFSLGCHAVGEPVHLTYLHSIVVFALLRYRQVLLEARGFQRSFITSSDFKAQDVFEDAGEQYFSRYINLSGSVKHVWPKAVDERILSTAVAVVPIDGDLLATFGDQNSIG